MLDWLRKLIGGPSNASIRHAMIRSKYDAAQYSDEMRRHWANADALSANSANSPQARRDLRNRARYEYANNSYAKGIIDTLSNDIIGQGPTLQFQTNNAEVNRLVESEFARWAKSSRLPEKLRLARMARGHTGEAFLMFTTNPGLKGLVKLDIRMIEADQIATPDLAMWMNNGTDGIVYDEYDNPLAYHVLKQHPGDLMGPYLGSTLYDVVPARYILHYFLTDRPGQRRGVPDIVPALNLFAQLRRYTLAVLAAAETAADFAAVLETPAPAESGSESAEDLPTLEIMQRMMVPLPEGYHANQMKPEQPATTYPEFKAEILNEIARCLHMPYNIAACNSSSYNYASGRLDHQTYDKSITVERQMIVDTILDPVLDAWLSEASRSEGYLPDVVRFAGPWSHQWFFSGREHVDPAKEAAAQAQCLASHTTTLASEYAKRGLDWQTQLEQRAVEVEFMKLLGLVQENVPANQDNESDGETSDTEDASTRSDEE